MSQNLTELYWKFIREKAKELSSDGCSVVSEWRRGCCLEHDVHYRTRQRWGLKIVAWDGADAVYELHPVENISRRWADARFRDCIRVQGGILNDIRGWARWIGVRSFGWWGWRS